MIHGVPAHPHEYNWPAAAGIAQLGQFLAHLSVGYIYQPAHMLSPRSRLLMQSLATCTLSWVGVGWHDFYVPWAVWVLPPLGWGNTLDTATDSRLAC